MALLSTCKKAPSRKQLAFHNPEDLLERHAVAIKAEIRHWRTVMAASADSMDTGKYLPARGLERKLVTAVVAYRGARVQREIDRPTMERSRRTALAAMGISLLFRLLVTPEDWQTDGVGAGAANFLMDIPSDRTGMPYEPAVHLTREMAARAATITGPGNEWFVGSGLLVKKVAEPTISDAMRHYAESRRVAIDESSLVMLSPFVPSLIVELE